MTPDLAHAASALAATSGFSREERRVVLDLLRRRARDSGTDERHGAVLARLGVRDFAWPEFDRWQSFFAECGEFPPRWDHLRTAPALRAPAAARTAYRIEKLQLLLDLLHGLETSHAALARYAKRGIRVEVARQDEGARCLVCERESRREATGGAGRLPPFHPGCRCLLVAVRTARIARPLLPHSA